MQVHAEQIAEPREEAPRRLRVALEAGGVPGDLAEDALADQRQRREHGDEERVFLGEGATGLDGAPRVERGREAGEEARVVVLPGALEREPGEEAGVPLLAANNSHAPFKAVTAIANWHSVISAIPTPVRIGELLKIL